MPPPNTPEDPDAQLAAAIAIENAARSANADTEFLAQGLSRLASVSLAITH